MSLSDGKDYDLILITKRAIQPPNKKAAPFFIGLGAALQRDNEVIRAWHAPGFTWDPPVLLAEAANAIICGLLPSDGTVAVHSDGLRDRLRHVSKSPDGKNSSGHDYTSIEHYRALIAHQDAGKVSFRGVPREGFFFASTLKQASEAAEKAKTMAVGMGSFLVPIWRQGGPDYLAIPEEYKLPPYA